MDPERLLPISAPPFFAMSNEGAPLDALMIYFSRAQRRAPGETAAIPRYPTLSSTPGRWKKVAAEKN
jgi:hypothetical protein